MNPISAFFVRNIILVFFLYGLAFFAMGLALALASRRASEFRFVRAIQPLAAYGLLHGLHEWLEMFQKIASLTRGYTPTTAQEMIRLAILMLSLLMLLAFGLMLLNPGLGRRMLLAVLAALAGLWLLTTLGTAALLNLAPEQTIAVADALARYGLAIPGALLGAWALMTQQRTFHEHGMPQFGRDLVWAATALLLYGVVGQMFVRETVLAPSQILNSTAFLQWFGIPVQLFRGVMAMILALYMVRALNAFELEAQRRLEAANEAKLRVQAEALEAERRTSRQMEQLNEELRQTTRELALLLDLSNLLAEPMSLQDRLRNVLLRFVPSLGFPDAGLILLVNRPLETGLVQADCGYEGRNGSVLLWQDWSTDLALRCATKPLMLCRYEDGTVLESSIAEVLSEPKCHQQATPPIMIGMSLMVHDQVIGGMVLASLDDEKRRRPGIEELRLIMAVAQQLGLSIENARLYQEAQVREQRLGDLLRQAVTAQETERQRIARELHDATGQSLTAIALGLRGVATALGQDEINRDLVASQLNDLKLFSTNALGELREIIADLRPSILDDMGLVATVKWYLQAYEQRRKIKTEFFIEGTPQRLPSEYETVLFRIAQEALTNIAKHAQATHVTAVLRFSSGHVCLIIEDDGRGFDPEVVLQRRGGLSGWGLLGIQERAALAGGQCAIDSAPGQGTRIYVSVPLVLDAAETENVENQVVVS